MPLLKGAQGEPSLSPGSQTTLETAALMTRSESIPEPEVIVYYQCTDEKGVLSPAEVPNKQLVGKFSLSRYTGSSGFDHTKDKGVDNLIVYFVYADGEAGAEVQLRGETVANHQFKSKLSLTSFGSDVPKPLATKKKSFFSNDAPRGSFSHAAPKKGGSFSKEDPQNPDPPKSPGTTI
jgi:hypothetical protein